MFNTTDNSCSEQIESDALFCHICGQPLFCPNCGSKSKHPAKFCPKCGRFLNSMQSFETMGSNNGRNYFRNGEVEMSLTDKGLGRIGDVLPMILNPDLKPRQIVEVKEDTHIHYGDLFPVPGNDNNLLAAPSGLDGENDEAKDTQTSVLSATVEKAETQGIRDIFKIGSNGNLRLEMPDLKAQARLKDYQFRFVLLYLYAADEILGEAEVDRAKLYEAMDQENCKDGNLAMYFKSDWKNCIRLEENKFRLNSVGKRKAQEIVERFLKRVRKASFRVMGERKHAPEIKVKKGLLYPQKTMSF